MDVDTLMDSRSPSKDEKPEQFHTEMNMDSDAEAWGLDLRQKMVGLKEAAHALFSPFDHS